MNPRIVLRGYGWIAIVLGLWPLMVGGGTELGARLQPAELVLQPSAASPYGPYIVPRLVGILVLTAGLVALGFARVDDPEGRRRGLNRFAAAHVVLGVLFSMVASALLDTIVPQWIIWGPLVVGGVLGYCAIAAAPLSRDRETLHSQYEAQIRLAARREERARLARDLHDAVKQQLFVIQTAAATAETRLDTDRDGVRTAVDHVREAARQATTEMEALIDQLRAPPMEHTGFVDALRTQCEALGFRTGAQVALTVGDLPPANAVPPGTHEALYRFAQEALANVGRHARARRVTVAIGLERERLAMTITDDGVGFDPAQRKPGMGYGNMEARASEIGGTYHFTSAPGAGTTVGCAVPLAAPAGLNVARTLKWGAMSGGAGFLLYLAGSPGGIYDDWHEFLPIRFLTAFGVVLVIAAAVTATRSCVRAAARLDSRLLKPLRRS